MVCVYQALQSILNRFRRPHVKFGTCRRNGANRIDYGIDGGRQAVTQDSHVRNLTHRVFRDEGVGEEENWGAELLEIDGSVASRVNFGATWTVAASQSSLV